MLNYFYDNLFTLKISTNVRAMFIEYSAIPGYFLQDDPRTNATTFDYVQSLEFLFSLSDGRSSVADDLQVASSFGLVKDIDADLADGSIHWSHLAQKLKLLNRDSGANVQYKLLFLVRTSISVDCKCHDGADAFACGLGSTWRGCAQRSREKIWDRSLGCKYRHDAAALIIQLTCSLRIGRVGQARW